MMSNLLKRKLDEFISDEYDVLIMSAKALSPKTYEASELITITYMSFLDSNVTDNFKIALNSGNFTGFFVRSMRNQLYSSYRYIRYDIEINDDIMGSPDDDTENIKHYNKIKQMVDSFKLNGNITHYQYNVFMLFYYPEYVFNIERVNDVKELRKMSLRKLEKLTNINHVTLHHALKIVRDKIVDEFNKNPKNDT